MEEIPSDLLNSSAIPSLAPSQPLGISFTDTLVMNVDPPGCSNTCSSCVEGNVYSHSRNSISTLQRGTLRQMEKVWHSKLTIRKNIVRMATLRPTMNASTGSRLHTVAAGCGDVWPTGRLMAEHQRDHSSTSILSEHTNARILEDTTDGQTLTSSCSCRMTAAAAASRPNRIHGCIVRMKRWLSASVGVIRMRPDCLWSVERCTSN